MKLFLRFALVCLGVLLFACEAPAQVTVTGNLQDAGVASITSSTTYVHFELRNFGSNIPRVDGSGIIARVFIDMKPDGTGEISGTVQGNDTITPVTTFYNVCIYDKGVQFRCAPYLITGDDFDLNTAIPMTQGAVPVAPSLIGLVADLPGTCRVGQVYFATDATAGRNLYFCTAIDTWTLQPDGPAGATGATGATGPAGSAGAGSAGSVNHQTGTTYTAVGGDNGKNIIFTNSSASTLTLPAVPPSAAWWICAESAGLGGLTINRNSLTIDGAGANISLTQDQGICIYTDGTNYFTQRGVGGSSALSTDNIWTASNRFRGPIPYRDVSSYFVNALGHQVDCSTLDTGDPATTGTISASSTSLAVANGANFKDGCGVAIMNAGPAATLTMASTASGTATRCADPPACSTVSGVNVLLTVSSSNLAPGIGSGSDYMGFIKVTGCSDSNLNTTGTGWLLNYTSATKIWYATSGSSGTTATGCTATFYYGYAHGTTGSTTWNYKVAPIDNKGGVGVAVGPITITNGNATLSPSNYNWIGYQYTTGARMFAIYRDDGAGGAYTCINISYSPGYSDWGHALPYGCPAFVPSTPPAAPTKQTLNTRIVSGGGTNTLVLADAATSTATTKYVYHDEGWALDLCITDAAADQNGDGSRTVGSSGCFIPAGRYPMNRDMGTDTISGASGVSGGVAIKVAGTLVFQSWPWLIGSGYDIEGEGSSAGTAPTQSFPTTTIERGLQMPSGMVIHGSKVTVSNFSLGNMMGHGMYIGADVANAGTTAGISINNMAIGVQDSGTGVPLLIDSNALFYDFDNIIFYPRPDGFPASILFTSLAYGGNGHSDIDFHNIFTIWHHIVVDSPGGQNTGQGTNFNQSGFWRSEEHGQYPTGGLVTLDGGAANLPIGAPSTAARLAGAVINSMQNADASNKYLLSVKGTQSVSATMWLYNSDQFITNPHCDSPTVVTPCQTAGASLYLYTDSTQIPSGMVHTNGPVIGGTSVETIVGSPLVTSLNYGTTGADISSNLPAPIGIQVTGTGSGSLSADTYCFVVVGLDYQATPGYTQPSPEVCQPVGASGSIALKWYLLFYDSYYSNFRVYFGTSSGIWNNYFTVSPVNSIEQTYNFTTTAAASAGSPPTTAANSTARTSWLGPLSLNGSGCLNCSPFSANASQRLGVGDSNPPSNSKFSVKGGILNSNSGFECLEGTAPSGVSTYDILYCDSTTHRFMVKNNNGAAAQVQVAGDVVDVGVSPIEIEVANAGSTGTTSNKLAKLTGAPSTAVIAGIGDTIGVLGCVVSGSGTTGNAVIAIGGTTICTFDGATVAGDYVVASTSSAGSVHDAGASAPTGVQILGRVKSTNGAGGDYSMVVFPPEVITGAGGGGSGAFSSISSGTNSAAAMVVDSGASIAATGSGTITATAAPFSGISSGTNITGAMILGTGSSLTTSGLGTLNANKVNSTTVPSTSAADQFLGTTAATVGAWASMPSCLDSGGNHINYNTSTHAFSCGTSGGTAGSAAFNTITSGTNSSAAMVVDTGASLAATGSGTITATAAPFAGLTTGSNTTGTMTLGTGGTLTFSGSGVVNANQLRATTVAASSAADQFLGTTGATTGVWADMPNCTDAGGNHVNYNTSTHLFSCGTSGGTAGSAAFNTITAGTNSSAAMVVGTGASLAASGSGTITATAAPFSGLSSSTNSSATMTVGTGGTLTTSGSGVVNANQVSATTFTTNAASNQIPVTTSAAVTAWKTLPSCTDSAGNHLNYNNSTQAFTCGTTSSSGNVTSVGLSNSDGNITVTGSPITTSGTLTVNFPTYSNHFFLGNNSGGTLAPVPVQPLFGDIGGQIALSQTQLTTNNDLLTVTGGVLARKATGTSVQVLHGTNIWGAVSLTADVTGITPVANGGTGLASGTSGGIPYFSASGTIASSGALTANLPVFGGGAGATPIVGTRTGNTTQVTTWSGATTASRCVHTDASGNAGIAASDCLTNPMTTLGDMVYGGAAGAVTRLAGNTTTTPYVPTSTGAAGVAQAPVLTASVGGGTNPLFTTLTSPSQGQTLAINSSNVVVNTTVGVSLNPQTGTTYTVVCGAGGVADRGRVITLSNAAAIAVTVPLASTSGCDSGFNFTVKVTGAGAATLTPASGTINGGASIVFLTGQQGTCVSDNTSDYICTKSGYGSGTTGSIGGGALTAGTCTSGTATIIGASTSMTAAASPVTYPGDDSVWKAYVSASNTVTVKVCAMTGSTPTASAYNVRLLP